MRESEDPDGDTPGRSYSCLPYPWKLPALPHTPLESVSVPPNEADNQVEVKFTPCSGQHKHTRA